ncbi:MAG TPA: FAD-dependent thymidylate synthase [Chthonomonadales bacterium]|nr:FAD-dependent thymidylate synthase [Chthonomonadales bacterium]
MKDPRERLAGDGSGYPGTPAATLRTERGTPYLREPGVQLLARPAVSLEGLRAFLDGFDPGLRFAEYVEDTTPMPPGAMLCKVAGQLCYASFGPRRTYNRDADRYFDNIKQSGHGSVLEHACYSLLLYGISRSVTHELVRHRAGFGFSQLSQRYVSGRILRFVERPEFAEDPALHARFVERIDRAAADYAAVADALIERQRSGEALLSAEARTDLRKKVQQAARALLPNEAEAPIVVTGNARAWRHFLEMRASPHAEIEIRALAFAVYAVLVTTDGILFGDYSPVTLPDGTLALEAEHRKV